MRVLIKQALLGLFLTFPDHSFAQTKPVVQEIQQSGGACSVSSVNNNGTINLNCPGASPEFAAVLEKKLDQIYQELRQQSELSAETTQRYQNQSEQIDLLQKTAKEAVDRYQKLITSLPDDEGGNKARELIEKGELDQAEAFLKKEAAKEEQGIKQAAETQYRLGSIYAIKLDWKGGFPYFKRAFELRPDELFYADAYGIASYASGQFQDAEKAWTVALKLYRDRARAEAGAEAEADVATALSNFGNLYAGIDRAEDAEKVFNESLNIRRGLAARDPSYRGLVASSLYNLATLYDDNDRDAEAERSFKDSIALYREALPANADELEPRFALAQSRFAYFYYQRNRMANAERLYKDACSTYSGLAARNPIHRPELAAAQNDLAWFYEEENKPADAERSYGDAMKTLKELQQANASGYQYEMQRSWSGLADIYANSDRKSDAEKAYTEAVALRRDLASHNSAYRPLVMNILINFGVFYFDTERFSEAEAAHEEALGIARDLASMDPAYRGIEATALLNLGNDQNSEKRNQEAEKSYGDALAIYRDLAKQDADSFEPLVAAAQQSLGYVYKDSNRFPEASAAFREALSIYRKRAKDDRDGNRPQIVQMMKNLKDLAVESRPHRVQKSSR